MKIEPVFKEKLEIGKFYQVPTVYGVLFYQWADWPVIGPMHEDKEIINFPAIHYHLDFRFFTQGQWGWVRRVFSVPQSGVLHEQNGVKLGPVVFRRRKCQREYPAFPLKDHQTWLFELRQKYKKTVMTDWTCPHRGASLRGMPIDEAGCVTCPLHGLRWDLESGKLAVSAAASGRRKRIEAGRRKRIEAGQISFLSEE